MGLWDYWFKRNTSYQANPLYTKLNNPNFVENFTKEIKKLNKDKDNTKSQLSTSIMPLIGHVDKLLGEMKSLTPNQQKLQSEIKKYNTLTESTYRSLNSNKTSSIERVSMVSLPLIDNDRNELRSNSTSSIVSLTSTKKTENETSGLEE